MLWCELNEISGVNFSAEGYRIMNDLYIRSDLDKRTFIQEMSKVLNYDHMTVEYQKSQITEDAKKLQSKAKRMIGDGPDWKITIAKDGITLDL